MCSTVWEDRTIFLRDTSLELIGYQVNFDNLRMGLVYFTHKVDGCFTTLSIKVNEFYDMNPGKRYRARKTQTEDCPSYCFYKDNLQTCEAKCECAFVRELLIILQKKKLKKKK